MMLIGYLNLAVAQLAKGVSEPHNMLIACGVQRMFIDIDLGSGATPQLEAVLAEISAGDTLVSPSVDFMTRSIVGLLDIHSKLDAKGAALRVLQLAGGMPLDTSTAEGRAILGALAVMSALPQPMPVAVQQGEAKSASAPAFVASAATLAPTSPQTFTGLLPSRPRGRPATAVGQAHEVTRLRSQVCGRWKSQPILGLAEPRSTGSSANRRWVMRPHPVLTARRYRRGFLHQPLTDFDRAQSDQPHAQRVQKCCFKKIEISLRNKTRPFVPNGRVLL